jgi:hypothetical protein
MVRDRALFAFAARAPVAALEHMFPYRANVAVAAEHADQFANLDHGALATPRARERQRLDRQPIEPLPSVLILLRQRLRARLP